MAGSVPSQARAGGDPVDVSAGADRIGPAAAGRLQRGGGLVGGAARWRERLLVAAPQPGSRDHRPVRRARRVRAGSAAAGHSWVTTSRRGRGRVARGRPRSGCAGRPPPNTPAPRQHRWSRRHRGEVRSGRTSSRAAGAEGWRRPGGLGRWPGRVRPGCLVAERAAASVCTRRGRRRQRGWTGLRCRVRKPAACRCRGPAVRSAGAGSRSPSAGTSSDPSSVSVISHSRGSARLDAEHNCNRGPPLPDPQDGGGLDNAPPRSGWSGTTRHPAVARSSPQPPVQHVVRLALGRFAQGGVQFGVRGGGVGRGAVPGRAVRRSRQW